MTPPTTPIPHAPDRPRDQQGGEAKGEQTIILLDRIEDALRELGKVVIVQRYLGLVGPLIRDVQQHRDALASNSNSNVQQEGR